jgi:hypothetical protein
LTSNQRKINDKKKNILPSHAQKAFMLYMKAKTPRKKQPIPDQPDFLLSLYSNAVGASESNQRKDEAKSQ